MVSPKLMRKPITISLLLLSVNIWADKVYISPAGNDGTGNGSIATPYYTIEKAWADVSAGDTIYVRGGTYQFTTRQDLIGKNGTAVNNIYILAYPGEKPVFTEHATYNRAVQGQLIFIDADYLYVRGLDISGFEQTLGNRAWSAFFVDTTRYSTFENLSYHDNGMSMQIQYCKNVLVLNCDFYRNYDPFGRTPYDGSSYAYNDADGLNIRNVAAGDTNIVRGCRFWSNADDGLDLWGNDGYQIVDRCWAWKNGYREDGTTTGGDGGGLKMGETVTLDSTVFAREVTYCISVANRMFGITQNGALCKHYLYNNTVWGNLYRGIYFSNTWGYSAHVLTNNIAYGNTTNTVLPATCVLTTNSWSGITVNAADFSSLSINGLDRARKSDGSLPAIYGFRLAAGSDLINAGTSIGLTVDTFGHRVPQGGAVDIGAHEYGNYPLKFNGKYLRNGNGKLMIIH